MHPPEKEHPDCGACGTRGVCIAHGLTSDDLDRFARHIRYAHVWPGTDAVVFDHDDPFDNVYAVRKGCVKTYTVDAAGHEKVLGFLWPGHLFGHEGVLNRRYPYSARALMPSEVCVFSYAAMRDAMGRFPDLNRTVVAGMLEQVEQAEAKDARRPASRLAAFLLDTFTRLRAASGIVRLPMRWTDIANHLGMAPRTLRGLLSRFEHRKLLLVRGQDLVLMDRARLAGMAGAEQTP